MVVLILEKVPRTLRGELSRWMIEPRAGVFVGQVSAMVRDRLFQMAVRGAGKTGGGVILLHTSSATEQGFAVRVFGDTRRDVVDWEGLSLVHIPAMADPKPRARAKKSSEGIPSPAAEPSPDAPDDPYADDPLTDPFA